jgi:hypothetical protein
LPPHAVFKLLRHRKRPPNLWKFGLDAGDVIAAGTILAMAAKLSPAEAMVEEKRSALVRAQLACTKAIVGGRSGSAAHDYFDVYRPAVKSNRKRLRRRSRRWAFGFDAYRNVTLAMARATLSAGHNVTAPGAAPGAAILVPCPGWLRSCWPAVFDTLTIPSIRNTPST